MSTACAPPLEPWPLSRRGQDLITWDVDGLPAGAVADLQLEGDGPWYPMMINTERDRLSVWAAGPSFGAPAVDSVPVTVTSHAEIRIQSGQTTVYLDGGYIELLP